MKTILGSVLLSTFMLFEIQAQKIVAYLPSYRDPSPTLIQYSKATDIYYSFINPDLSGNLILKTIGNANFDFEMNRFQIVKGYCAPRTAAGPNLWIAVGGADPGNLRRDRLNTVCGAAGTRSTFVNQLVQFAINHELEGIDLDWEFPTTAAMLTNFTSLVNDLRAAINASTNPKLKISVAIGGETTGGVNHVNYFPNNATVVANIDYFNVMTYDLPSTYDANNHSTLANSNTSLTNWNSLRGIPKSKMLMGIPFYGRNPGRTLIMEYRNIPIANFPAAFNNDFTTVSGTTYYYNGKTTVENKVAAVVNTHQGAGVLIWDIGEDRTDAYSLMTAIHTRMFDATTGVCSPRPFLGRDTVACSSSSLTLNSGVNTSVNWSFAWFKNNVSTPGTSNTLAVNTSGYYKVTTTRGLCVLKDSLQVTALGTTTTTGATICDGGTLNLSSGANADWYSSATDGQLLASNTNAYTTPNITSTTTYYVQPTGAPANKIYGSRFAVSNSTWNEAAYDAGLGGRPRHAQKLTVLQTLTLKKVVVYSSQTAVNNVAIYVMDGSASANIIAQTTPVNLPAHTEPANRYPNILTVNITLQPGTYFVGVYAPGVTGTGAGISLEPATAQAFSWPNVCSIEANEYQNWGGGFTGAATTNYGQIYDWQFETPFVNPCGRTPVVATVKTCTPPVVTFTNPSTNPYSHVVNTALNFTITATDADGTISSVRYIIQRSGFPDVIISGGSVGPAPNYTASWTPTAIDGYTVIAEATDNDGKIGTATITVNVTNVLPVEWISFTGESHGATNLLVWTTASEVNHDFFEAERSSDGVHFVSIGRISGANSVREAQGLYTLTDYNPGKEVNYYRIAQYDLDGSVNYSWVIQLQNNEAGDMEVLPNPFDQHLILRVAGSKSVEIYDAKGIMVLKSDLAQGDQILSVAHLSEGLYQVRIVDAGGSRTYKMLKK